MRNFLNKHQIPIYLSGLLILCLFFFFYNLGEYHLIDIDETRYVNIAKTMFYNGNYITPYLNFEPFLEKPPLYYWLIILSYKLFGIINNFTSRFPVALLGTIGVFGTYFFAYNILKSKTQAFLSAVILMTSFWYALFSHIAILDLGFTVFTMLAFYCGVSTLFIKKETSKKILWYLGYAFLGLSVLQKGLIGIIVPGASLLAVFLILKRAKEIVKPSYIIPGIIIFLLITAPWHYLVFKENGLIWFNEYIVKHHFARFLDSSMDIGRHQPFYFYIPVVLGGFLPWTFFLLAAFAKGLRYTYSTVKSTKSVKPLLSSDTNDRSLILISLVYFFVVFIFFSISSTKLPTYILTAFPPLAILTGYFFFGYIEENKNKKYIEISALITLLTFLAAGIFGLYFYAAGKINIGLVSVLLFIIFSVAGLIFLAKNKKVWLLGSITGFSFALFVISSSEIFNYVTSFGQNELEEYAQIAKENDASLVTFNFSKKYSMSGFYDKKIFFIPDIETKYEELEELKKSLTPPVYIITKNKKEYEEGFFNNLILLKSGTKYNLYKLK